MRGEYKKNYRSKENFIHFSVAVMDCDNDHSEDPEEWITPEKMEELFGDYSYAIAFSRNHMKVKDGKSERPRFHVYFQIEEIADEKVYAGLKIAIQKQYAFFDDNALDAARFIFGADTGEVIWHEGWMTIDEEISPVVETDEPEKQEGTSSGPIVYSYRLRKGADKRIYDRISDITISMKGTGHFQMPELINSEYPVYLDADERMQEDWRWD